MFIGHEIFSVHPLLYLGHVAVCLGGLVEGQLSVQSVFIGLLNFSFPQFGDFQFFELRCVDILLPLVFCVLDSLVDLSYFEVLAELSVQSFSLFHFELVSV